MIRMARYEPKVQYLRSSETFNRILLLVISCKFDQRSNMEAIRKVIKFTVVNMSIIIPNPRYEPFIESIIKKYHKLQDSYYDVLPKNLELYRALLQEFDIVIRLLASYKDTCIRKIQKAWCEYMYNPDRCKAGMMLAKAEWQQCVDRLETSI